jgi:GNAT superfamily N-acetyltransferase
MQLTIDGGQEADIPALQALAAQVYRRAYAADHDADYIERFLQRMYSTASLQRALHSSAATLLLARLAGQPAGVCHFGAPLFEDCKERQEIHRLYVHPDHCRQGIGGRLVGEMVRRLRAGGVVQECVVYVPPGDIPRRQFYHKMQFRHAAERDQDGVLCLVRRI